MIKVRVIKKEAKYQKISIIGHAMYAPYGKDIVCSAASSIVTTSINGILALNEGSLSYEINKEGLEITVKSDDNNTQILIKNMISLLKELEKDYPTNIEVK